MKKTLLLVLVASLSAWAADLPPAIPAGPISYNEVSYAPGAEPASDDANTESSGTETAAAPQTCAEPVTPSASSDKNLLVSINAYSSNYQVRGMGFTDDMTRYGWSSVNASYTLPNRNFFSKGIQQRFSGTFGMIWGAGDALGDTPVFDAHYAMGKEIFPNLLVEAGYTLHRGGMEGFAARFIDGKAHRVSQDFNLSIAFDDQQKGFFGHALWGVGFQGLTGSFFDFEAGYRFTDVLKSGKYGADMEVSAGIAPSFGYWGGGVEGIDAVRVKVALPVFTDSGAFSRDGAWQLKPWVQCSWSGNNAKKIERACGGGPVDHVQLTVGVEVNYRF